MSLGPLLLRLAVSNDGAALLVDPLTLQCSCRSRVLATKWWHSETRRAHPRSDGPSANKVINSKPLAPGCRAKMATAWFEKGRPALFEALSSICDQIGRDVLQGPCKCDLDMFASRLTPCSRTTCWGIQLGERYQCWTRYPFDQA